MQWNAFVMEFLVQGPDLWQRSPVQCMCLAARTGQRRIETSRRRRIWERR